MTAPQDWSTNKKPRIDFDAGQSVSWGGMKPAGEMRITPRFGHGINRDNAGKDCRIRAEVKRSS